MISAVIFATMLSIEEPKAIAEEPRIERRRREKQDKRRRRGGRGLR